MTEPKTKILVWDAPVRVFHWLLVLCFAGAYLTAESERWRLVHVSLGYTMGGLVAFRLVWGLMGTRYARFSSFVRGPGAVVRYVRAMLRGEPEHHVGHNPAGAVAIVLLLLSSVVIVATGWAIYNEVGGNILEDLHEGAGNFMLAVVAVHVAGVVVASRLHKENLVRSMLTGRKEGAPSAGISRAWVGLAAVVLAAVLGFWWLQWKSAPSVVAALTSDAAQYSAPAHAEHREIRNAHSAG
jgi:cytochrome b